MGTSESMPEVYEVIHPHRKKKKEQEEWSQQWVVGEERAEKRGRKKKEKKRVLVGAAEQDFFGLCSGLRAPGQNELLRCSDSAPKA